MNKSEEKNMKLGFNELNSLIKKFTPQPIQKNIESIFKTSISNQTHSFVPIGKNLDYCMDYSGMAIDAACANVTNALREYAGDSDAHPYKICEADAVKLKKHYAAILLNGRHKDKIMNNMFYALFYSYHIDAIITASNNSKMILSEKNKKKISTRKHTNKLKNK